MLRRKQPDRPRPYRVPFNRSGAWVSVLLTTAGVLFAITLFFYLVPTGTARATYWWVTGGGTVLSMLVGWWLARRIGAHGTVPAVPLPGAGPVDEVPQADLVTLGQGSPQS
jgi:amino acid transporter